MPIIPLVGRRAPKIRLLFAAMYFLLTIGAITMVYPFLRMLSLSVSNSTDYHEIDIIPKYLLDDSRLLAKYADEKYSGDLNLINALYQTNFAKMELAQLSTTALTADQSKSVEIWQNIQNNLPDNFQIGAFRGYGTHPSGLGRKYRAWARGRFKDDIASLNQLYTEEHNSFQTPAPPPERSTKRNWSPDPSPKMTEYMQWRKTLPEDWRNTVSPDQLFAAYLKEHVRYFLKCRHSCAPLIIIIRNAQRRAMTIGASPCCLPWLNEGLERSLQIRMSLLILPAD